MARNQFNYSTIQRLTPLLLLLAAPTWADAVLEDYLQEEPFCDYVPIRTKRRLAEAVETGKSASAKNK